jgi:hypothetical protein
MKNTVADLPNLAARIVKGHARVSQLHANKWQCLFTIIAQSTITENVECSACKSPSIFPRRSEQHICLGV